jgi:uncharacterized small protein (DUF1192 family)
MNRAKQAADLTYTVIAIALILYTVRGELRRMIAEKRSEIERHTAELRSRDHRRKAWSGYVSFLRERGIEPTGAELEGATHADA